LGGGAVDQDRHQRQRNVHGSSQARTRRRVTGQVTERGAAVAPEVRSGDVPEAILAEIDERGVDLVVMATRGHSGLVRAVLGSVTSEVVSRSPVPVVLLRVSADEEVGQVSG
jgi:nucleotide-binding universal stress UspA family protein